jgi:prolyl 4-hydroxylase
MTLIRVVFVALVVFIHASSCLSAAPVDSSVPGGIQCTIGADGEKVCAYNDEEDEVSSDDTSSSDDHEEYDDAADNDEEDEWEAELTDECKDHLLPERCSALIRKGRCENNPGFMKYACPLACDMCDEFKSSMKKKKMGIDPCMDQHQSCKNWAAMGECGNNPNYMLRECARSCLKCYEDTTQFGVEQSLPSKDHEHYEATVELIKNTSKYMKDMFSHEEHNYYNYKCRNMESDCCFWAATGDECETNQEYMHKNCAPACQVCHLLDVRLRCPILPGNEPVFKPGDLNALFENIVDNADGKGEYVKYNPKALSRPKLKRDGTPAGGDAIDGPWIVSFENFISDEEADALIAAGAKRGYERSADVGIELPDGTHEDEVNDGRTSENAWCDKDICESNPVIMPVIERIATVTGTHRDNHEDLQLLRYEPGQFYNQHHDYIEYQQGLPCGVRMLTLFLYLNDVEEGGGTSFPLVNDEEGIVVQPKKGNALLWPSVLDEDPEKKDGRTDHEALPVLKGIKYGKFPYV